MRGSKTSDDGRRCCAIRQACRSRIRVRSTSVAFDSPLDWTGFRVWLSMLVQIHGPNVPRIKGLLNIGDAGPVITNVAQHVVHPPEHLPAWPSDDHRSNLVFITCVIDPERIASSLETFQHAAGRTDLYVVRLG